MSVILPVVGWDPSLTGSGLASTADDGQWALIGNKGLTSLPLLKRIAALRQLRFDVASWIVQQCPELVVIEQPAFSRAGGGAVERHWLFYAVIDDLTLRCFPIAVVTPTARALYACGKGNAKKSAVVDAVARRWPQFETKGDDNVCDAVTLAALGADHLGRPLAPMPATHRAALAKVNWPNLIGDNT